MLNVNLINSTHIELLTKHNYDMWLIKVEALLTKNYSWPYVNGDIPRPVITGQGEALAAAQVALDNWTVQDRKAKSDLVLSISPTELKHIRNCNTSKEVWNRLKSLYASQGPIRKATLLEQLLLKKMREDDDVRDYLFRYMDTVDKLHNMDIEINGDQLSIMLLHSLPSSFDNFCCAIKSRNNLPDIDALTIKIIEERDSKIHKNSESDINAMFSKQRLKTSIDCATGRQQGGRNLSNEAGYRCHYCKRKGHKAVDCFKKKKDAQNANVASDVFYADEISNVSINETCNYAKSQKWCLDSGCTSHFCKDPKLFAKSYKADSSIKLANETTARATAKGDVNITVSNCKQSKEVTLANALYVPDFRTNLLSIAKIIDKNREILFTGKHAYIKDANGAVKMVANREGDLFYLREGYDTACTATDVSNSSTEWHRRLGHLNWKSMSFMLQNEMASGLTFRGNDILPRCEVCAVGKLSRLPFPKREQRSPVLLGIVHTDVCGPMRTQSQSGARYFSTFTDDYRL